MKYSELISFNPIEDVIQLTTADDAIISCKGYQFQWMLRISIKA